MHIPQETLNSLKSAIPSGNRLIIDWISISTKHDPKWLIGFLGLETAPWEVIEGYKNGYSHRYEFGNIRVYFSVDMSYVNGYYLLKCPVKVVEPLKHMVMVIMKNYLILSAWDFLSLVNNVLQG